MYISSHRGPAPFLAMGFLVVAAATAAVLRGNLELKDCVRELLIYSKKKLLITTTAEVSSSSLSNSKKSRRATLPSSRSSSSSTTTTTAEGDDDDGALVVKPIGTIRSIYRLCVGTPRQGLLAPSARGRIELTADNASDMVDSLEKFSHVWIVFVFHLNTSGNRTITKIAPPALGGKKVGVLATRSPHRGNPIGMTLCQLDSIMTSSSSSSTKGGKQKSTVILNISGLDLVDGTPVLDIKPYVPHYDSVPSTNLQLPSWVSGGLATKRPVQVKDTAQKQLLDILKLDPFALDFYGPHRGDEGIMDTMTCVLACITQVLSVDVRSNWQTKKARVGKSQAERASRVRQQQQHASIMTSSSSGEATAETTTNKLCSQQLDNLLIQYSVDQPEETNRETSEGSGAEDVVVVHSLQLWLKPRDNNNTSKDNNNNNKNKSGRRHQVTAVKSDRHIKEASNSTKKKQQQQEYDEQQQQQYDAIQSEADIEADLPKSTEIKISPSPPEMGADFPVVQHYWDEAAIVNTPGGVSPVISARHHAGAGGLRRSLSHSQLPFARLRMQSPLPAIRRQTSDGNLANRQE